MSYYNTVLSPLDKFEIKKLKFDAKQKKDFSSSSSLEMDKGQDKGKGKATEIDVEEKEKKLLGDDEFKQTKEARESSDWELAKKIQEDINFNYAKSLSPYDDVGIGVESKFEGALYPRDPKEPTSEELASEKLVSDLRREEIENTRQKLEEINVARLDIIAILKADYPDYNKLFSDENEVNNPDHPRASDFSSGVNYQINPNYSPVKGKNPQEVGELSQPIAGPSEPKKIKTSEFEQLADNSKPTESQKNTNSTQLPIVESKSAPEGSKAYEPNTSQTPQGSLVDDFANPMYEPADYMGGDD